MRILFYTRRGCHLCEAAEDLLAGFGVVVPAIDVDAEPEAAARYGLRVPVLEVEGEAVLEGRFDERRLAALLAGHPALRVRGEGPGGPVGRPGSGPT